MSKSKQKSNSQTAGAPKVPTEWLYMAEKEITPRDIYESLGKPENIEIWDEAGVLEITLGEKTMDMEQVECDLQDEVGNEFLAEHGIHSLFLVDVPAQEFPQAEQCMRRILSENGGFFCGDTEDFTPVVR